MELHTVSIFFWENKGALYLGVDALQSPNGFDIMGVVIYWLKEDNNTGEYQLEAMTLDLIQILQSHTGKYMAQVVQMVVEKFKIQDKVTPWFHYILFWLIFKADNSVWSWDMWEYKWKCNQQQSDDQGPQAIEVAAF